MRIKTILAVDDTTNSLRTIKVVLEKDYRVLLAKTGEIALFILQDTPVDLILLDIDLPAMSGFDVLREIRKQPNVADTPVIFVTSHASGEILQAAGELGVDDYIIKPILPTVLEKKIAAALAAHAH
ncbi:MAG: response regulator [Treponema sp.]|jgi:putative two-component system response regulator|nr:response regulator [Treponema sp.]